VADLEACAAVVAQEGLWRRYGLSRARARALLRGALRAGEPVLVAVRDGAVVGFVWFQVRGTFAHSGYVRWIATHPSVRGQGVGAALLRAAEARILRHGPNVFLLVSHFNRRAQRFYRAMGYRRVGVLRDYVRAGIHEEIYRKTTGPLAEDYVRGSATGKRR
jgi:ribosomal protein S18 acetylase RimI-like enzyme